MLMTDTWFPLLFPFSHYETTRDGVVRVISDKRPLHLYVHKVDDRTIEAYHMNTENHTGSRFVHKDWLLKQVFDNATSDV